MAEALWLEDLVVGQRFVSGKHEMTAPAIKAFAAEFDPQPFHLDEATAAGTFFGGLAASGWHTAAVTMRLLVGCFPIAGGVIGASGELRWPMPTRPGDVLHVVCTIETITPSRSRPDRGTITTRNETFNQNGEIVQTFVVNVVVPRRRSPDGGAA
jgi:acyl dehydratase